MRFTAIVLRDATEIGRVEVTNKNKQDVFVLYQDATDVTFIDSVPSIDRFLHSKLMPISDYISSPDDRDEFFVQLTEPSISGDHALKFIYLADVFGYDIHINKVNSFITIYFTKK